MDAPCSATINEEAAGHTAMACACDARPRPALPAAPPTRSPRGGGSMVESLAGTLRDLAAIVLLAFALVSPLRAAPPPVSAVAMPPVDRHATDVVATVHP